MFLGLTGQSSARMRNLSQAKQATVLGRGWSMSQVPRSSLTASRGEIAGGGPQAAILRKTRDCTDFWQGEGREAAAECAGPGAGCSGRARATAHWLRTQKVCRAQLRRCHRAESRKNSFRWQKSLRLGGGPTCGSGNGKMSPGMLGSRRWNYFSTPCPFCLSLQSDI